MSTQTDDRLTQIRLPGQAAAPDGPCDMTGMFVMHHAFRRDLPRFTAAARSTPLDDAATWSALRRRWDDFARELHHHHTKEDEAIWPLLLERVDAAGDHEAHAVLTDMEAEHSAIDPLLAQVEQSLADLTSTRPQTEHRDSLARAFAGLTELLDQHLAHEERAAIPVIQERISAEEWAHLEKTALRASGTPKQMMFLLAWAAEGMPDEVLARLLGGAPLPVRVLLKLGRRGYARSNRRAFVHVD
ncbi:hemerythrin domain-containing protein [Nocardioides flavescens]|uniref:Hemerythrin domain-containing protein n=1 Tax=Nocardioides flavescens TaxID=2691959 RepID=A0A6L7EU83_9ACTN|nr:hemerythrin domain-containing protein [Nocardioides flavescens]MXG89226.1 hemerythrin domain-containing protein [Nocardioides flavescens]